MRRWLPLLALLGIGLAFLSIWRASGPPAPAQVSSSPAPASNNPPALMGSPGLVAGPSASNNVASRQEAPSLGTGSSSSPSAAPVEVDPLPPELASVAPETVLENMRTTVRQYGAMFAGNPVGTNPEITQALQGANPKHINFLKADGNRVNSGGELVDFWGTPYFFHQISASEMEIRSAGPDRRMYTADDLVIR